ncbi:GNAT family N-acetyltransferase [Schinkia sp. CFF1]
MSQIFTDRLLLIPCPLDLAKSIILDRKKLEERSPVTLPSDWPSVQLKSLLPYYIELLDKAPNDRSLEIWLIIDPLERKVIGSLRVKSKAADSSTVDIGYEIIEAHRKRGVGYEAVQALVNWLLLNHKIEKITAECDASNIGSIRILEKVGMYCIGKEASFLNWELKNERSTSLGES